jgi:hypothetical protein
MIVNYSFEVSHLHVIPNMNGLENVIQKVSWNLIGTTIDVDGKEHRFEHSQTTTIKFNEAVSFISANDITLEVVQGWVYEIENKRQRNIDWLKTNIIDVRLDEKINPTKPKVVKPFWEQQ